MATSISGAFEELKTNLEITGLQTSTVSTRQQNVRDAVEKDFTLAESFLIGSYKRHTMITPLTEADIDVFVVLNDNPHWDTYQHSPNQLLQDIKTTLKKTYPKTPSIKPDGPAVTITFNDFVVDVVPAFIHDHGGYLIPDQGQWLRTDPKIHTEIVSSTNDGNGGDLVPLIKMIKQWNRHHDNKFRNFYLELLTTEAFTFGSIDTWEQGFANFISHAVDNISGGIGDPAGFEGRVRQFDTGDLNSCWTLLGNTADVIAHAGAYESNGNLTAASQQWQRVFSKKYFPEVN